MDLYQHKSPHQARYFVGLTQRCIYFSCADLLHHTIIDPLCIQTTWDRGFEPHSGLQVSKKQNVSSLLTLKDSILR